MKKVRWVAWIVAGWCVVQGAAAQDLQEMYRKASELAQEGKFEESAAGYAAIVKEFADFAWEDYGPGFGGVHYDYGLCLIQLRRYEEAAKAFRACHDDFPPSNKIPFGNRQKVSKVPSQNARWEMAIFQLGYAHQMMEDYQGALDHYQKFLDLKPDPTVLRPVFAALLLRRSKSLIGVGKLEEGQKEIIELFDNANRYQASGQLLFQAMLDLALGWVDEGKRGGDIVALTASGNGFLDKYGPLFSISPYEKYRLGFVDRLRFLAYEAQRAGLNVLALRFSTMAPTSQAIVSDMKARAAQMAGPQRARLEAEVAEVETRAKSQDPPELESLRIIAAAWEGLGNRRAGYVIHRHLVEKYPASGAMAQLLHEAARFAFSLGDANSAQYYGEEFMEKYPNDPLRENVSAFMLQSLFGTRQYQLCLETAGKLRENFEAGDVARELSDFIYGASLYYLNRQPEAEKALALHVENYPDSGNREAARFFQASNKIILAKYGEATPMLDSFLQEYASSKFRDQVLFDRAVAHYMTDEFVPVLQRLDQLFAEHADSTVLARGYLLRGDVYRTMARNPEEGKEEAGFWRDAKVAFTEARDAAERLGQQDYRGEALFKLMDTCVDLEDWDDAVKAYDTFIADHAGSFYEPQVSVFAMPALQQAGRTEAGLVQLEKMILALSERQDVALLAKAIGSYQTAAVEELGYEQTLAVYDRLIGEGNTSLQTQLLIHKLILFEEQKKRNAKDEALVAKFQGEIDAVFEKLSEYKMEELSDPALRAIGSYFEESNPFKAKPYFEALLDREDDLYKAPAEMALGRIEKAQKNPNAVQRFIRVIERYGKEARFEADKLVPEAQVSIGEIAVEMGDWELAEEYLVPYINNKRGDVGNRERRAQAQYLYAYSLEMRKDFDGAIQVYNALFGAYPGYPKWSAQGVERGFNIAYKRDNPDPQGKRSDQIKAYTFLRVAMFTWQKVEPGVSEALDRLRLLRDRVEGELGLTAADIEQIEVSRGLRQN